MKYIASHQPHTLVVLLFGLQLVKVDIPRSCYVRRLVERILDSGDFDISPKVQEIARQYKARNFRCFTPEKPFSICDMNDIPKPEDLPADLIAIWPPELGKTSVCADEYLPSDGSCLNLIVEEPLPIEQIPAGEKGDEPARFRSREVVLYLNQYQAEVFPSTEHRVVARGYMGDKSNVIWCKLVDEDERNTFESLQSLGCESHHIVTPLLPPYPLPTGQYLVTMPNYGSDLSKAEGSQFCGHTIHRITRQLCVAIRFLHTHGYYHLDIKHQNIAISRDSPDITVLDLGCVVNGGRSCVLFGVTGTCRCVAPEVQVWHDHDPDDCVEVDEANEPPPYDPRKADIWAIGNVVCYLLEKEGAKPDYQTELQEFGEWLMSDSPDKRPTLDRAIERLDKMGGAPLVTQIVENASASYYTDRLLISPLISAC
ncbi:hypothetical protein E1B28_013365 [Marasmius oreades]|uniref:Protein kinase domain-containing protein n=1 Tax=Marasmius oreades TaxID=181124 RepID=A0A9P7UPU1_9AGAR|nr:uncharacterized protein E1B28_013365 [Marasmius oreades]KAG7087394.1 hypothetical protein E1B28_013365 [Marasmius oreades]